MRNEWIECGGCLAEFRVISDNGELVEFCPFCGGPIEYHDDQDDTYIDEDDE